MVFIKQADYVKDYRIHLVFNTGEEGIVDLSDVLDMFEAAQPLKDPVVFQDFYLDSWPTLAWQCGFDLAPEMLYERATGKKYQWQQAI